MRNVSLKYLLFLLAGFTLVEYKLSKRCLKTCELRFKASYDSEKKEVKIIKVCFSMKFVAFILVILIVPNEIFSQQHQFDISNSGYAQPDLQMGKDSGGYIIAVWTDHRNALYAYGDEDGGAVYGQIYNPELQPVGSNFRISKPIENGITADFDLDLFVFDDGRFAVTWQEAVRINPPNGSLKRRIVLTILDRNGETILEEQTVNDDTSDVHRSNPQIGKLPGNRFLVMWSDHREGKRYKYGQYYDAENYTRLDENIRLGPEGYEPNALSLHIISDSLYLLVYDNRYLQYHDDNDIQIGEWIDLPEQAGISNPSGIYVFSKDSLMALYSTEQGTKQWFKFVNLEGTPVSSPVLVNDNAPLQTHVGLDVAKNPDGSFLTVWEDRRNSYPAPLTLLPADIYAQRYDAKAQPIGMNFKLNYESQELNQLNPKAMHHNKNNYFIAWHDDRYTECPKYGEVNLSNQNSYQTAMYLDFDNPEPQPVWGWENYLQQFEHCDEQDTTETRLSIQQRPNYPNPFNGKTTFVFELETENGVRVEIEIFDSMGRKVAVLQPGTFVSGTHEVVFDASNLASGIYFSRLKTSPSLYSTQLNKFLLIRQ